MSPVELTDGEWYGGGGEGAKSYDGEKAWSSRNHSILTAYNHAVCGVGGGGERVGDPFLEILYVVYKSL